MKSGPIHIRPGYLVDTQGASPHFAGMGLTRIGVGKRVRSRAPALSGSHPERWSMIES